MTLLANKGFEKGVSEGADQKLLRSIEMVKSAHHKHLLEEMMNYVTNISWGTFSAGVFKIFDNGMAFLLNLGHETFLVTAAHVYEGFLAAKAKTENFKCVLGDIEIYLEEKLICSLGSNVLDIATFKITDSELSKLKDLKKYPTYGAKSRPIERALEGNGIVFAGFPGEERESLAAQEYVFGLYTAMSPVTTSNEGNFTCHLKRENWIDTIGKGLPIKGYRTGGISGAPAFLYRVSDGGLITLDLAGVIYEANGLHIAEITQGGVSPSTHLAANSTGVDLIGVSTHLSSSHLLIPSA